MGSSLVPSPNKSWKWDTDESACLENVKSNHWFTMRFHVECMSSRVSEKALLVKVEPNEVACSDSYCYNVFFFVVFVFQFGVETL